MQNMLRLVNSLLTLISPWHSVVIMAEEIVLDSEHVRLLLRYEPRKPDRASDATKNILCDVMGPLTVSRSRSLVLFLDIDVPIYSLVAKCIEVEK